MEGVKFLPEALHLFNYVRLKNHSKAAKNAPKNDYGFNLGKMQNQHFSLIFVPPKGGMGDLCTK